MRFRRMLRATSLEDGPPAVNTCPEGRACTSAKFVRQDWYTATRMPKLMALAARRKLASVAPEETIIDLSAFVPLELKDSGDAQAMIPRLAKDEHAVRMIEQSVQTI